MEVNREVKQEDKLTTTLFNIALDDVIRNCELRGAQKSLSVVSNVYDFGCHNEKNDNSWSKL